MCTDVDPTDAWDVPCEEEEGRSFEIIEGVLAGRGIRTQRPAPVFHPQLSENLRKLHICTFLISLLVRLERLSK